MQVCPFYVTNKQDYTRKYDKHILGQRLAAILQLLEYIQTNIILVLSFVPEREAISKNNHIV